MAQKIDPKYIVNLKGKDYPLWAGILSAATSDGLRSLVTRVIQLPSPENGHLAVVTARAEFEDGRAFEDVGDCSPASTSPQLASAALRLASTRAKGRALRDSQNIGQTMFEELPDLNSVLDEGSETGVRADAPERLAAKPAAAASGGEMKCSGPGCGKPLTKGQHDVSVRSYGQPLCPACQKQHTRAS